MRSTRKNNVFPVDPSRTLILSFAFLASGVDVTHAVRPEVTLARILTEPFAPTVSGSPECLRDSAIYLKEIQNYTPWALKMYDSSAKLPSGLIGTSHSAIGSYSQCVEVETGHGFVGQSCFARVVFEIAKDEGRPREPDMGDLIFGLAAATDTKRWTHGKSAPYSWMWCVPSTCNHSEIEKAVDDALDPVRVPGRVNLTVRIPKEACRSSKTDRIYQLDDWIFLYVLGFFALIVAASTSYEMWTRGHVNANESNERNSRRVILTSFSLYKNGKDLLSTERSKNTIGCLDGLRALSLIGVLTGHTLTGESLHIYTNLPYYPRIYLGWVESMPSNVSLITDTFLLIGGCLLAYTELSKRDDQANWRFEPIKLYVRRYLRLTPAYAVLVAFYATLFYKIGAGVHWEELVGPPRRSCRRNWWKNLLYLNNFARTTDACLGQAWYLAVDMQLIWLSPIVLYPMLKLKEKIFWLVVTTLLVLSALVPYAITQYYSLPGIMLYRNNPQSAIEVFLKVYFKTYCRFGVYVIGIALGYILHKRKSRPVKMPTWLVCCGWIITSVIALVMIFAGYIFQLREPVTARFYAGFHRQAYSLFVAWLIFCCVNGYGGVVEHFLSWRGWIPICKVSYCGFLCHYAFILTEKGLSRSHVLLSAWKYLRCVFANCGLTFVFSVLLTLAFEMPFVTLSNELTARRRKDVPLTTESKSQQEGSRRRKKDL